MERQKSITTLKSKENTIDNKPKKTPTKDDNFIKPEPVSISKRKSLNVAAKATLKCKTCAKSFNSIIQLNKHMITHSTTKINTKLPAKNVPTPGKRKCVDPCDGVPASPRLAAAFEKLLKKAKK